MTERNFYSATPSVGTMESSVWSSEENRSIWSGDRTMRADWRKNIEETSAIRVARTFVFADIDVEQNREHALGSSFLYTLYEKKAR